MLSWRKDSEIDKKNVNKPKSPVEKETGTKGRNQEIQETRGGMSHKRLGDLLLEEKLITLEQLAEALKIQSEEGGFLGRILVEKGFIKQDVVSSCLAKQCKIPHINLVEYDISPEVIHLVPEEICRRRYLLPIDKLGRILTVAMVDPLDTDALEEVRNHCPDLRIKPILCSWDDLNRAFDKAFRKSKQSGDMISVLTSDSLGLRKVETETSKVESSVESEPILPASILEEVEKTAEKTKDIFPHETHIPSRTEGMGEKTIQTPIATEVVVDTSIVQAIHELPRILSESIRESLTQVNINIPMPPPPPTPTSSISEERFSELIRELSTVYKESITQVAQNIYLKINEDRVEGQNQIASVIQSNIAGVFQQAIFTMVSQLKEEMSVREKNFQTNTEQLAQVIRNGISELSNQLLNSVSNEIQNSTRFVAQIPEEVAKTVEKVVEKIDNTDQKLSSQMSIAEKTQEILLTVKDSIVNGLQTTLESAITKLVEELRQGEEIGEPDPVLLNLTEAIKKLDEAILENRKVQESQVQKFAQITESVIQSVQQTTNQAIKEIIKDREREHLEVKEEKPKTDTVIPELKEVVEQLKESVQKTQKMQDVQTEKITRLTETTLESVQQTAQLVETLTVMEGKRIETLEEKKRRLSAVSPFGNTHTVPPEELEESDKEVWKALESEQPLETLTFDNFFPGSVNAFTFKLSKAVAENPGSEYNPYFLYGNVGIGKTHLISAIGNGILKKHPKKRVGYVSASHFSRRLAEALKEGALDLFRENYCHWDVLILDDIQFLGGKVDAQEEFFHVFNVLHQSKRQIIIASDKAPDRLGMLEQRLVSRFSSGIVAELKSPEWETRMQILRNQIKEAGVQVPEEVLSLIAMRVPNDVRKMMGSLKKIIAFAKLVGQSITCEMADEILSHLGVVAA
ncbi:MAG: DnaA ATPase domain-containing protein [Candidatus Hydrogenedens sp.]